MPGKPIRDDLPLGLTLREHVDAYLTRARVALARTGAECGNDSAAAVLIAAVATVLDDIGDIVEFTRREAHFHGAQLSGTEHALQVLARDCCVSCGRTVRFRFLRGDAEMYTADFDSAEALSIADAVRQAATG